MSANLQLPESNRLVQLAEIASFSWFVSSHGPWGFREPALWKSDFVEVQLERWRTDCSSDTVIDPWTKSLYHMVHLNLHSNIDLLQRHARLVAKIGHLPLRPSVFCSIERWRNSRHYRTCRWHAEQVLEIVKSSSKQYPSTLTSRATGEAVCGSPRPPVANSEPPHVPFCIYYATLILWYGGVGQAQLGNTSSANMWIELGAGLLFQLKAHVATHLGKALYELRIS